MADIKGKEILYEDDDEPIKLTDHDVSQNINEFKLSLIGKILNPKKQSVEKLIQKMRFNGAWRNASLQMVWEMESCYSTLPPKMS